MFDYERLEALSIEGEAPQSEPERQYYFMKKCRQWAEEEKERIGHPLTMSIQTLGCQMNAKDSEKMTAILEYIGYKEVEEPVADFVLYNTCTVRENANLKIYGRLGYLKNHKKKNPSMKIALCGCMMQEADEVERIRKSYSFVDLVFGTHNIYKLAELLYTQVQSARPVMDVWKEAKEIVEDLPGKRKYPFKTGVNIMYGCNNFCSYCIVPYVRGRERSREPEDIISEIKGLVADGVVEVMLLGQNVNSYGKTLEDPVTFANLLRQVNEIEGLKRIRFMTSHPKDLSDELIEAMGVDIKTYTYDGDTPGAARKAVRQAGHIVVTNPDMLHSGILPHHTKWVKLFENLRYIVIDEIHTYRGVFGSNLANVLRRLLRLCDFYGSHPQFILCSATIANPKELAETLTGREVSLVDDNGAPMGVRHFVFYNPPVVNRQLGIRKGVLQETRRIAGLLLQNGIQAITFARSRLAVEVLTKYLKDMVRDPLGNAGRVRGYRGGYLPTERREIERGLRAGRVDAVVSTNALELGIDIGALDACVLCGYPGTIASAWQQAGRAGRRKGTSIVFYVASSAALDQYIVSHPDYLMKQSPENALLNPDNLYILLNHFKCAAFELPFEDGEGLGNAPGAPELLEYLDEAGILRHVGGRYHWSAEDFPASEISLRSARAEENFVIIDTTDPANHRVIGEMDRYTVPMLLHENAIYMHEAQQYQVEKLDFDACKAFIRRVDVGYYTDANLNVTLSLLDKEKEEEQDGGLTALGEIRVST